VLNLVPAFAAKRAAVNGIVRVCRFFSLWILLKVQENLVANMDTLIADVDSIGSGEELLDIGAGLGAEITMYCFLGRFLRSRFVAAKHDPICFLRCGKVKWFWLAAG
jgi:hypothetical protein